MKKIILVAGILIIAAGLGLVITMFVIFKDNSAIQDGQVLNGFSTVIKDGFVSCYVFDTGKGEVGLIDACDDPEGKAILAVLNKKGLGPDAVRAVFLTHGDKDHTAACPLFKKAKIYCMDADVAVAEGREKPLKPIAFLFSLRPLDFKVTDILRDGDTVRAGTVEVKAFIVPGHTRGSAVLLAGGVLFLGDSVNASKSGNLTLTSGFFNESTAKAKASMIALALRLKPIAGKIMVLAPSHTGPLIGFGPLLNFAENRQKTLRFTDKF